MTLLEQIAQFIEEQNDLKQRVEALEQASFTEWMDISDVAEYLRRRGKKGFSRSSVYYLIRKIKNNEIEGVEVYYPFDGNKAYLKKSELDQHIENSTIDKQIDVILRRPKY